MTVNLFSTTERINPQTGLKSTASFSYHYFTLTVCFQHQLLLLWNFYLISTPSLPEIQRWTVSWTYQHLGCAHPDTNHHKKREPCNWLLWHRAHPDTVFSLLNRPRAATITVLKLRFFRGNPGGDTSSCHVWKHLPNYLLLSKHLPNYLLLKLQSILFTPATKWNP